MEVTNTLHITNRKDWHTWLERNHKIKKEIWLIYYRKETKKPRISYDGAVLEALCYGRIDGIIKKINKESFAQRFSPRRSNSNLSQMNKERIRELIKEKKMTKCGLEAVAHSFNPKTDNPNNFILPPEIIKRTKSK